ncbi:MAG: Nre family DNA repair protein [Archaeoglobaceae archaeon]|nr:Nre family DNA repair protein [Archaeoglobaceae archaeon]
MQNFDSKICVLCRGRMLCSLPYCPILSDYRIKVEIHSKEIFGSSPPSIFVGRVNYPKVRICPAVPPLVGDTTLYDKPELWAEIPIEKILEFRYSLIHGQFIGDVRKPNSRIANILQEISLYERPVELEVILEKPPAPRVVFDESTPPMGPSAPAKEVRICSTPKAPKIVEEVYYSQDLGANQAIKLLYDEGIAVSHIQKLLSAGVIGKKRKLVPTRWAITAVDDTISKQLIENIKSFEILDTYRVFVLQEKKNLFMVILTPHPWCFEWGEAWFPQTTWNYGKEVVIETDWEDSRGRKMYASLGGCYYASRLATAEYLIRIGKQAGAILWREIYPGFKTAIGVWFVREMLRKCFNQKPAEFNTLEDALNYLSDFSKVGVESWIKNSKLIENLKVQKVLWNFF